MPNVAPIAYSNGSDARSVKIAIARSAAPTACPTAAYSSTRRAPNRSDAMPANGDSTITNTFDRNPRTLNATAEPVIW